MSKERTLQELTYFSDYIHLASGQVLKMNNGELLYEGTPVLFNEYIKVEFNQDIAKSIGKFVKKVIASRGVKDINNINEKDPDVRSYANQLDKSYKEFNKTANVPKEYKEGNIAEAISHIYDMHASSYQMALVDVIMWAAIQRDLFKITSDGKGLEVKIEGIEPSENHFKSFTDNGLTETEMFLLDEPDNVRNPIARKNEKVEITIAIVKDLLEKYPEFSETYAQYIKRILAYFSFVGENVNDKDESDILYFRKRVEDFLVS